MITLAALALVALGMYLAAEAPSARRVIREAREDVARD